MAENVWKPLSGSGAPEDVEMVRERTVKDTTNLRGYPAAGIAHATRITHVV
jgi:hypothetical protein